MQEIIKGKCTDCLTGKHTYELDPKGFMCPYVTSYTDKSCFYYKPMKKTVAKCVNTVKAG